MFQQFKKELEQKPFDSETFVERLALKILEYTKENGCYIFNADTLSEEFSQSVQDLTLLLHRQMKKCDSVKTACKVEERHLNREFQKQMHANKGALNSFYTLDGKINSVAVKVMHLGGQLEAMNVPRSRSAEAQKLMTYFSEFLSPNPLSSNKYTDQNTITEISSIFYGEERDDIDSCVMHDIPQLFEAADTIRKLYFIAQELPNNRFEAAKKRIEQKYDEIEQTLIKQFVEAHQMNSISKMREIASILSHFKGYSQCVDAFIEESQQGIHFGPDVFADVVPICQEKFKVIDSVFSHPEQVNAKFVLNIYISKLQDHIVYVLSNNKDSDRYLRNLMDMYSKMKTLSQKLSVYNLRNDPTYLQKLTHNIFHKYLDSYITTELKFLKEKFRKLLQDYYNSKGHQKKQHGTSFQELRRDIQAVIGTRANFNIAQIEDYGGETFLSEEISVCILQETKLALKRCHMLSHPKDVQSNALQIFDILLHYLITEYVDYAIDLGTQSVPIPESSNQQPEIYFFEIVQQTNIIVHLLEKLIIESLVPIMGSTMKLRDCVSQKTTLLEQTEMKLDTGLDRSLAAAIDWVKIYLQAEQKKSDFKPETDVDTISSPACRVVVQFIKKYINRIRECLHGKNAENVLIELAVRFHKAIYDHLLQFTYNSNGALCAICDVNEYRKCIKEVDSHLITTLFDTLHALCNLLLVKPENLEVCCGETLAVLDNSVLTSFIQLRSDYKSQKLSASLKGFMS